MNAFISDSSHIVVVSQSPSHIVNTKSHDVAWRRTVVAVTVTYRSNCEQVLTVDSDSLIVVEIHFTL